MGNQGGSQSICLIKSDEEYNWSTEETLELLLKEHFLGFVKQNNVYHEPREKTGGLYKTQDKSLVQFCFRKGLALF